MHLIDTVKHTYIKEKCNYRHQTGLVHNVVSANLADFITLRHEILLQKVCFFNG